MSEDTVMTAAQIQAEHGPWAKRNFGDVPSHVALIGMFEELGEQCEARLEGKSESYGDAVGDVQVYMVNLCNIHGFDMQRISDTARTILKNGAFTGVSEYGLLLRIMQHMGRVCHGEIKAEQGIRGSVESHRAKQEEHLGWFLAAFYRLVEECSLTTNSAEELLSLTWDKVVRKRDWVLDPDRGGGGEGPVSE